MAIDHPLVRPSFSISGTVSENAVTLQGGGRQLLFRKLQLAILARYRARTMFAHIITLLTSLIRDDQ